MTGDGSFFIDYYQLCQFDSLIALWIDLLPKPYLQEQHCQFVYIELQLDLKIANHLGKFEFLHILLWTMALFQKGDNVLFVFELERKSELS